ncbi:hypothetical protein AGMMS50249_1200 [candidate division SR1 bacterium]|nr:hypothetical protein AGMMS50249_1200 [candidate division SR1 bacterium]
MNEAVNIPKITIKVDNLANKNGIQLGNTLSKMKQLNKIIKKGKGYTTTTEKEIYNLKDEILLENIIKKNKLIKDMGKNTTVRIKQG